MAFAQQRRRPKYRSQPSFASISSEEDVSPTLVSNHILSPGPANTTASTSDSEVDWHVISSALRSSSSATTSSSDLPPTISTPQSMERRDSVEPSEPESFSSFRHSDTDSFSDIDFAFGALPSHDGTGAFIEDDLDETSEEESPRRIQQQPLPAALVDSASSNNTLALRHNTITLNDFEPSSPSMPNILLPYGGIHVPSFVTANNQLASSSVNTTDIPYYSTIDHRQNHHLPTFAPTVIPKDVIVSSDEQLVLPKEKEDDSVTTNASADQIKFTKKRRRNLDSIPTHHPSFPGTITSFAILSAIWSNLRRLTNHLIENDTSTADAFTSLVSEATLEGCLPFGSHLHMELAAGLRPAYTGRRHDGLPGM